LSPPPATTLRPVDPSPFAHTVTDPAELATLYRAVSPVAAVKTRPSIDAASAAFIARSTFVVIGTTSADGSHDVSPRGGPPGFLRVLDPSRLVMADLSGNNRLDCIRNIIETGRIGLLAFVTGQHETVRINGDAWLTTDPELLDGFPPGLRRPAAAIGIRVAETFMHCAKSLRRAGIWDPASWRAHEAPDGAAILACQGVVPGLGEAEIRATLAQSYDSSLADERT